MRVAKSRHAQQKSISCPAESIVQKTVQNTVWCEFRSFSFYNLHFPDVFYDNVLVLPSGYMVWLATTRVWPQTWWELCQLLHLPSLFMRTFLGFFLDWGRMINPLNKSKRKVPVMRISQVNPVHKELLVRMKHGRSLINYFGTYVNYGMWLHLHGATVL